VRDGRARVEEVTDEPDITLDALAFAPIFTGRSTALETQALGRLWARTSAAVERADAIFAGATPWLFEHF
jgi:predicted acetyltransferase